jgi:predicted 2-oxoglutarate/Fe(II)-dependent dioxygenase YbiX
MVIYPHRACTTCSQSSAVSALAEIFWIQSLVWNNNDQQIPFDLDIAIQRIRDVTPADPSILSITGIYHNFLGRWSST